ncbi:MAG: sugar transporter permease, partial [Paenibacillus sp.]|nr:sugar transporter permease [Paenibacillus sp.]
MLAIPAILFSIVFAYLPMIGVVIAFQDFNPLRGLWHSEWIGLQNFKFFFQGQDWIIITTNTV